MKQNVITKYYDSDKILSKISETSEIKLIKCHKNTKKIDKNLDYYAIFFPRKGVFCLEKVYKIVGVQEDKKKLGKLELILDDKEISKREEKFIVSSYKSLLNERIKTYKSHSDYRRGSNNRNLFPAEVTKSSVIQYFKNN